MSCQKTVEERLAPETMEERLTTRTNIDTNINTRAIESKRQYQRRKLGRNLLRWRKLVRLMRFFMKDIDGGSMFRVRDYEALNEEK